MRAVYFSGRPGGEMANTLASGASARKGLEVRLLSWASNEMDISHKVEGCPFYILIVFPFKAGNVKASLHRRLVARLHCTATTSHSMIAPIGGSEQTKSGTFENNMLRSAARRTLGFANWHALLKLNILQIVCQQLP